MKYLVLDEFENFEQTDEITNEMKEEIVDGMIEVVRVSEGNFERLGPDGEWRKVEVMGS